MEVELWFYCILALGKIYSAQKVADYLPPSERMRLIFTINNYKSKK